MKYRVLECSAIQHPKAIEDWIEGTYAKLVIDYPKATSIRFVGFWPRSEFASLVIAWGVFEITT